MGEASTVKSAHFVLRFLFAPNEKASFPFVPNKNRRSAALFTVGGERGIRTPGSLARSTVFETAPFNRSGISPNDVDCVGVEISGTNVGIFSTFDSHYFILRIFPETVPCPEPVL